MSVHVFLASACSGTGCVRRCAAHAQLQPPRVRPAPWPRRLPADSNCTAGQQAHAQGDEVAMQANRFPPADPFVAPIDTNPNYDTRDPATGQPSLEVEITLSRK